MKITRVASSGLLLLALGAGPVGAVVLGGGNPAADCYVTFEGITLTGPNIVECRDGDPCDGDGAANGQCVFKIAICVNAAVAGCTPAMVSKIQNARAFQQPGNIGVNATTSNACAAASDVIVKLKGRGKKAGKRQIRTIARTNGTPKKDTDHFRLKCLPPGTSGPPGGGVFPGPRTFSPDRADSSFVTSVTGSNVGMAFDGFIALQSEAAGPDGVGNLVVAEDSFISFADAGSGYDCVKIDAAGSQGKIDCDGGTPVGVKVSQDSGGAGAGTPATLQTEIGAPGQAGDAYVKATVHFVPCGGALGIAGACSGTPASAADCKTMADFSKGFNYDVAFTSGEATAEVTNSAQGGTQSVVKTGKPLSCTSWDENGPGTFVMPIIALDIAAAGGDTANMLEIKD